jgi:hypothetical protein
MAFAAAASIVSGMAFGLLPAWRLRRMNLVETLSEDGVSPVGMSRRTGAAATRLVIVTGQIAVACVLLVAAMLLARALSGNSTPIAATIQRSVLGARSRFPRRATRRRGAAKCSHNSSIG